jgi:hypothetical protein
VNVENENPWHDDLDNWLVPDYVINSTGLYKIKRLKNCESLKMIAHLPIWPSGYGEDIWGDQSMIELSWICPRGKRVREWFPSSVTNSRKTLLRLPGSPVTLENVNQISVWLTEASGAIRNKSHRVLYGRLATEKEILKVEREKREEASRER